MAIAVLLHLAAGCYRAEESVPPQDAPWLDPEMQIGLLENRDDRIRGLAIKNLERMGPRARRATAALEKLTAHPNPKIAELARDALEAIQGQP